MPDPNVQIAREALEDMETPESKRARLILHWKTAGADEATAIDLANMDGKPGYDEEFRTEMLNRLQAEQRAKKSQVPGYTRTSGSMSYKSRQAMPREPSTAGAYVDRSKPFQMLHEPVRTPFGPAGGQMPQGWQESGLYQGLIPPRGQE